MTYIHLILLKQEYYSLEYYAMFDERSFSNQFIYNVGVLRTLHINGPNWFDNDLQNTTEVSERFQNSLKIPKRQQKPINRRTDNTMAKTKEKGQKDKQLSTKHYAENWRFGNISRKVWRYQRGNLNS